MDDNLLKVVPKCEEHIFCEKQTKYCLIIPVLNEEQNIFKQLARAQESGVDKACDIIICDGDSSDKTNDTEELKRHGVNTLLIKKDSGKQGAQLRMGFYWAIERGYEGIITIDGNNKDGIENTDRFIAKLDEGYDFIQGSRFIEGGEAINTPKIRKLSVKLLHSPIISLTAKARHTDSTNNFRAYSVKYLCHERVLPFRDIFNTYELLAYLSVRASQLGLKCCEVPVRREYPKTGKIPTKISFFKGNFLLLSILFKNLFGLYKPDKEVAKTRKIMVFVFASILLISIIGMFASYSNSNNKIMIRVSNDRPLVEDVLNKPIYTATVYYDNGSGVHEYARKSFFSNETVAIATLATKADYSSFIIIVSVSFDRDSEEEARDTTFEIVELFYMNRKSDRTNLLNREHYDTDYYDNITFLDGKVLVDNSTRLELENLFISKKQVSDRFYQQLGIFYWCAVSTCISTFFLLRNLAFYQGLIVKIAKTNNRGNENDCG